MFARTRRRLSSPLTLLWVAFLLIAVGACGSGAAGDMSSREAPGPGEGAEQQAPGSGVHVGATSGLVCGSARVYVARPRGAIDFEVRCRPRSRHRVARFAVGRAPLQGQAGPGIRAFRHRPYVLASDGSRTFGSCKAVAGGLACRAQIAMPALISGRIWVNPRTQCDFEVVISVMEPGVCTSNCSAVSQPIILAKGRPRGC